MTFFGKPKYILVWDRVLHQPARQLHSTPFLLLNLMSNYDDGPSMPTYWCWSMHGGEYGWLWNKVVWLNQMELVVELTNMYPLDYLFSLLSIAMLSRPGLSSILWTYYHVVRTYTGLWDTYLYKANDTLTINRASINTKLHIYHFAVLARVNNLLLLSSCCKYN